MVVENFAFETQSNTCYDGDINLGRAVVFMNQNHHVAKIDFIYMVDKNDKRFIMIQVTDDSRFYPDPLSKKEKYRLSKLNASIEPVPANLRNKEQCLYPQGRALQNYPDANWNTVGPKCANCILIAKQHPNMTFSDLVQTMLSYGIVCTPVVAPDGSIKVGESALCPSVASIYDSGSDIMKEIRNCHCHSCKIPCERMKELTPMAYQLLYS